MDFNFKEFIKAADLSEEAISILVKEKVDTESRISRLNPVRIAALGLTQGEASNIEDLVNERWPKVQATASAASASIKTEPGAAAATTSQSSDIPEDKPTHKAESTLITTTKLAADKELNQRLQNFLGTTNALGGLKDLLCLAELRSSVEKKNQGERVLLISDFLTSNINVSYIDSIDEEPLSGSTKLVREGHFKKPKVTDYTPEIWAAANFRIIKHLINEGTATEVLTQYVDYSSMIADYLSMYVHQGVFLLDFEHRHRVAKEGRVWNDILRHDELKYLKHMSVPKVDNSKQKKGRKFRKDSEVTCVSFNTRRGCAYGNKCRFNHVCNMDGCSGKHSSIECPKSPK